MENDAQKPTEAEQKQKESRLAYTLLIILLVAGGGGYGIYYWNNIQANHQAMVQLAEGIALDSSGRAADKQSRELVTARGWKLVDGYEGEGDDRVFYRSIATSENPAPNDWVLYVVFEGQSTKGVFVRTHSSKTTRPAGAPEDRITDKSKAWVKGFGG